MTSDHISTHLAETTRTINYALTLLDGEPDAIAYFADIIAGFRESRLDLARQPHPPQQVCHQSRPVYDRTPHRLSSPTALECAPTSEHVVWIPQIVEQDPNLLAIPTGLSLNIETNVHSGLHLILDKARSGDPKTAKSVRTARWL
jgi:hypothetical protein